MISLDDDGASMNLARYGMHDIEVSASDEARDRINSARVRDLAFLIRRSSKGALESADVDMLARVLAHLEGKDKGSVARTAINEALRSQGLADNKIEQLVGAVFNKF